MPKPNRKIFVCRLSAGVAWLVGGSALAGPFAVDDGLEPGDLSIWAEAAAVVRGPVDATVPDGARATYGEPGDIPGPPDAGDDVQIGVVSLGDGGSATVRLAQSAGFGAGADLGVFENGFSSSFLELAHVEVSSNGVDFVRFPSVSLTPTDSQVGGFDFGAIDPSDLNNLAGKYEAGIGTPFDLAELRGRHPRLDVSHVTHVRVIDVVGSIDPAYGSRDSLGNLINDPFKTSFPTGGFDLDAVGAVRAGPATLEEWKSLYFPEGGEDGDFDDPDGDGLANLLEYALAGDPLAATASPLEIRRAGGETTLRWFRAEGRAGVTVKLERSTNFDGGWTVLAETTGSDATAAVAAGVSVEEALNSTRVTVTLDGGAATCFYRLHAE